MLVLKVDSNSLTSLRLPTVRTVTRKCSVKKVFLEISQDLQQNTYARVSFLVKLQASDLPISSFLGIWSHLLKKSSIENFIFCTVHFVSSMISTKTVATPVKRPNFLNAYLILIYRYTLKNNICRL